MLALKAFEVKIGGGNKSSFTGIKQEMNDKKKIGDKNAIRVIL